jgi:hypothetical protein
VDQAIAEQRNYTEFAFEQLRKEITTALHSEVGGLRGDFGRLDRKLDRVLDAVAGTNDTPRRRRRS